MNLYGSIQQLLSNIPYVEQWPAMRTVLKHASARQPRDWRLPVLACEAVGGSPEEAIPVAAAVACLQISILLVDDMLDSDPRGEYRHIGFSAAANLAMAFQAAATEIVAQSDLPQTVKLAVLRGLNQMMVTVPYGQFLDTQNPTDEAGYWQVVQAKSASFFATAVRVGALAGGAPAETVATLERLGRLYGEMIQIHDDLSDTLAQPASPDWLLGRSPLPILFAQVVPHPDRARFLALHEVIDNPQALTEAQTILIRCGAVSYCVAQLLSRYHESQSLLANISLTNHEGLADLLSRVIRPVQQLLAGAGKLPVTADVPVLGEVNSLQI